MYGRHFVWARCRGLVQAVVDRIERGKLSLFVGNSGTDTSRRLREFRQREDYEVDARAGMWPRFLLLK